MKKIKILAINVCLRPSKPQIMFPLGLAYVLSAVHRAGYDFELLDLDKDRKSDKEIEKFLAEKEFDVVAFGCIVTGYKMIKNLSRMVRKANKKAVIIAGNSVADSIPRILLSKTEVDVAVIGEGEITIVEVLDRIKNGKALDGVKGIWFKRGGKIFQNPNREAIKDIDSIPSPVWDLFDMEAYIKGFQELINEPLPMPREQIRSFLVNAARGCPFRCTFCYQVFQHYNYRHRGVDSIIKEIKKLQKKYKINYILFCDDLSFPSKTLLKEFVDRVLKEKLKFFWTASCRSDLFNSEEDVPLLKRIKKSGCEGFGFSLESANKEILKAMNKHLVPENFVRQKKLLDKAGISSWTSLVLGYPEETKKTIKETMDLCYKCDTYPSSGYLLPQPGTPMYKYIFDKGIAKDEEKYLLSLGDRQDFRINLTKMSAEEFQAEVKYHLYRISKKLKLGLGEDNLLKTTSYKGITAKRREEDNK
ncbi:MAG: radical SAM protein [Candidatus Zambryskibacteria bacterium]